jgi:Ni,Fe-hydrogenase maturation factor
VREGQTSTFLAVPRARHGREVSFVIFVDASSPQPGQREPGDIRIEEMPLETGDLHDASRFSRVLSPHIVVDLAAKFYGAKLQAFLVTITGENFEHCDSLSRAVKVALPEVVAQSFGLVERFLAKS